MDAPPDKTFQTQRKSGAREGRSGAAPPGLVRASPSSAAAALQENRAAIVPTEAGFLLVCQASPGPAGGLLHAFADHQRRAGDRPAAESAGGPYPIWLPGPGTDIHQTFPSLTGLQHRLIRRLAPGPAIFILDAASGQPDHHLPPLHDSPASFAFLISGHPAMTDLLHAAASGPLVGLELWNRGSLARQVSEVEAAATAWTGAPLLLVEGEPPSLAKPATVIRLTSSPYPSTNAPGQEWQVVRPGAYEERFIRKQLTRHILFVCTGNTCRSPMAESIAIDLIKKGGLSGAVRVKSAGTTGSSGEPMTAEATAALSELGVRPVTTGSKPLTRQILSESDEVYVMTAAHRLAVLTLDPAAAARVRVLDPDGDDIRDPIGLAQGVYTQTALRMRELIERRLTKGL